MLSRGGTGGVETAGRPSMDRDARWDSGGLFSYRIGSRGRKVPLSTRPFVTR